MWIIFQVGRRMSGEEDILEDRIPAEDMLNVPNDCKSGGHKDKRSAQDSSDCWEIYFNSIRRQLNQSKF